MSGVPRLTAIESRSTSVVVADQLRERIIDGSFRPAAQINEAQVAAQLNVSRGPVREALQRLVQEGLLISRPNRGVFVRELTATDVAEIYAAREIIECAAAGILVASPPKVRARAVATLDAIADRIPAALATGDMLQVARVDVEFHTQMVYSAGNSRLHRAYQTLATETLMCMANTDEAYPSAASIMEEHRRLAWLIDAGDAERVYEELHRHLSTADTFLSAAVEDHQHRPRSGKSR